jgi:putative ABC transport system substrate-binding protein
VTRREFIAGATAAALGWPAIARGQQSRPMRTIGVLLASSASDADAGVWIATFERALAELGWTAGQNAKMEYRFGSGSVERLRLYAAELVKTAPDVVLVSGTFPTKALQEETRSIPIVFVQSSDPLGDGFVVSLAHPGGNITGFPNVEASMSSKWLELIKEAAPSTIRVGLMYHPEAAPGRGLFFSRLAEAAAPRLDVQIVAAPVRTPQDIESAIRGLAVQPGGALIALPDTFTQPHRTLIAKLVERHRLPAVSFSREFATAGGLMSYGTDTLDLWKRAASYVSRILKGERPAELPVQAPTKFELIVNIKAANAIGLEIPPTLLARADEVIE